MRDFIITATDNLYRPPNRILVSSDLLDQQYTEVQSKVNALIRGQESLNFVLDESSNISVRGVKEEGQVTSVGSNRL